MEQLGSPNADGAEADGIMMPLKSIVRIRDEVAVRSLTEPTPVEVSRNSMPCSPAKGAIVDMDVEPLTNFCYDGDRIKRFICCIFMMLTLFQVERELFCFYSRFLRPSGVRQSSTSERSTSRLDADCNLMLWTWHAMRIT